jgi:hypothetical protein
MEIMAAVSRNLIFYYLRKNEFGFALLLLIMCGLLFNPYEFAVSDHTYKIPFLKSIFHPDLYTRDITVSMKSYYTTYFHVIVQPLERIFGIEIAFFIIFLCTQLLFYVSIYLLAVKAFKEKMIGLISVVLLLFPQELLGGVTTFNLIVEERAVAVSLLLFGIYLILSDRYVLSGCFFAFAANIHFVEFVNIGVFVAAFFLINFMLEKNRKQLAKKYCFFFVLLFAGTLPITFKSILLSPGRNCLALVDHIWLKMILVRSAHHFYPDYILFAILILQAALLLLSLFILCAVKKIKLRQGIVMYVASILSMIFGFILGCFFVKVYPILLGIQLSFFRASYMFVILKYMVVAYILHTMLPRLSPTITVLFANVKISVLVKMLSESPATALIVWLASLKLKIFEKCSRQQEHMNVLVFILVVVSVLPVFNYSNIHIKNPFRATMNENIDVQLWLKNNTSRNSLVLVPPYEEEFRIFSERSTVGSWKDWTYNCLSRDFAFSIYERLHDIGNISLVSEINNRKDNIRKYYLSLKENSLIKIARKYNIDYIIMERENRLNLEKLYENKQYVIYKPFMEKNHFSLSIN